MNGERCESGKEEGIRVSRERKREVGMEEEDEEEEERIESENVPNSPTIIFRNKADSYQY